MTNRVAELVKRFEGCRLTSYPDATGIWTVGYGHTPSHEGESITQARADTLLERDLAAASSYVEAYVKRALKPAMHDALTSFVFNLGARQFLGSTLLKRLNEGEYLEVPAEFLKWKNAGGRPLLGLLRRRVAEAALFLEDGLPDARQS